MGSSRLTGGEKITSFGRSVSHSRSSLINLPISFQQSNIDRSYTILEHYPQKIFEPKVTDRIKCLLTEVVASNSSGIQGPTPN